MKTLMGNNGGFANMGSVQIQAQPVTSVAYQSQQQTQTLSHPFAPGALSVKDAQLPFSTFALLNGELTVNRLNSLSDIGAAFGKPGFIFPIGSIFNHIVPTNNLQLEAGRAYDPRATQALVTTTTKFQPYEQATGISHERPEVVMMTSFQPLLNRSVANTAPKFISSFSDPGQNPFLTDAGRYFDVQYNIRNLKTATVQQSVSAIKQRFVPMHRIINTRQDQFNSALTALKGDASFLLNLVRIIESQKAQLDLRHDLYIVQPQEVINFFVTNFQNLMPSINPSSAESALSQLVKEGARPQYDCVDSLVDLGYTSDSVSNVFASTKIWMQLLSELKGILKNHSLKFLDIDPTYQKNDANPSTLLAPPIKYFDIAANLPALPTLQELISLQPIDLPKTLNILEPAYTTLYQSVFFKSEEARIAALARLLSREYRYSYALTRPQVQQALATYYSFSPTQQANTSMFDFVIGKFGNNITDFPQRVNNSLASIAQIQARSSAPNAAVGVLTFESKYVEGDTGTLTPGGSYFFDQLLQTDGTKFNTTGIDQLSAILETQLNQFSVIIDGLDLFSSPTYPSRQKTGAWRGDGTFLNNPNDVVYALAGQLINPANGTAQQVSVNDRLGAVYAQARKDNNVKTLLFLYTLARISRTYANNVPFFSSNSGADNTPLVDAIIAQLVTALEASVPESRTAVQLLTQRKLDNGANTPALTPNSVAAALRAGTQMTQMIEQFMTTIISQFASRTTAMQNGLTRYSGYLDTTLMMAAFDFAISMVAKYSNQQLVGIHHGQNAFSQGQVTFVVSQTATNHNTSFSQLLQRNTGEDNLMRELIMSILNVLRNLGGSLRGIGNYLGSPTAIQGLQKVAAILNNDKDQISMLFSEQQILMLASTVENLVNANAAIANNHQASSNDSRWGDPAQEIAILDESEVPPAMRDALYGYFGIGELASTEGLNKHIMTVGIPLGFTQRLKQKVNIQQQKRASFADERNDIVQIVVYKVDMRYPDIVYKPQRFLFEMSRFPVRYSTSQWLPIPQDPALNDIINAIPTQNFVQNPEAGTASSITAGVEYASSAIAGNDGIKGARSAFDGPEYGFLTSQQRVEILHNHVASQLLESYVEIMTGVNVAEYNFHMVEPPAPVSEDFIRSFGSHAIAHVTDLILASNATQVAPSSGGVLFATTGGRRPPPVLGGFGTVQPVLSNPAGIAGRVNPASAFQSVKQTNPPNLTIEQLSSLVSVNSIDGNLARLGHRSVPILGGVLRTVTGLGNTLTSLADSDALNKIVVTPKMFDRVFSLLVDPREFDIDVEKTNATPFGRASLNLLITSGEIVPNESDVLPNASSRAGLNSLVPTNSLLLGRSFPQGRAAANVGSYRFRDLDVNQGDLVADKYVITVESLEENG